MVRFTIYWGIYIRRVFGFRFVCALGVSCRHLLQSGGCAPFEGEKSLFLFKLIAHVSVFTVRVGFERNGITHLDSTYLLTNLDHVEAARLTYGGGKIERS